MGLERGPGKLDLEENSEKRIDIEDLRRRVNAREQQLDTNNEQFSQLIDQVPKEDLERITDETDKKEQEINQAFLNELTESPESFSYVFETKRGSTYFALPSEHTLRIKKFGNRELEIQTITKKLFFLSPDAARTLTQAFLRARKDPKAVNVRIPKAHCAVGMIPFELDPEDKQLETMVSEDDDTFTIVGTKLANGEVVKGEMRGSFHIGHPITRVIKNQD